MEFLKVDDRLIMKNLRLHSKDVIFSDKMQFWEDFLCHQCKGLLFHPFCCSQCKQVICRSCYLSGNVNHNDSGSFYKVKTKELRLRS